MPRFEFAVGSAATFREAGAVPALYMVWPDASRTFAFPDVAHAYTSAAEAAEARLFPAGSAWLAAWDRNANLALYGPDNFHPSKMGSYLAALVIYASTEALVTTEWVAQHLSDRQIDPVLVERRDVALAGAVDIVLAACPGEHRGEL